jgi:hypothetical protein
MDYVPLNRGILHAPVPTSAIVFSSLLSPLPVASIYTCYEALQLIPHPFTQIRHSHDLDHQARPAREVLRTLPLACFWIVLFPCKPSLLPTVIYRIDQILAQFGVDLDGPSLMQSFLLSDVLGLVLGTCFHDRDL